MDFFFYGTLLDPDIRRLVLGPAADGLALDRARLKGYRRVTKAHSTVPVLVPQRGALIEGLIARGLAADAVARLVHYEGSGYRCAACRVQVAGRTVPAAVFLAAKARRRTRARPWRLALWQRRHKRRFLPFMALWMAARRAAPAEGARRARYVVDRAARD